MKTPLCILILFLYCFQSYAQTSGGLNLSDEQSKKIDAAFTVGEAVKKAGAYIQSLQDLFTNGEITLPVGVKQKDYELIIQKISQDEKTKKPVIYATCAFTFKDTGQRIAFEGQSVIEGKNGLGTNGKLKLIAPVRRDIGKESTLIIHEGTSATFGCDGIESFHAKITWEVTSSKIIPVNENGVPTGRPLSATVETDFQNFDNYLISLNINQSFCFGGLNDIIFTLKGATLDQSDTETSQMTRFPSQYFSHPDAETIRLWRGVSITEASVSLPQIFNSPVSDNGRMLVSLQQVLFDENGFSGNVTAYNIIPNEAIDPESWGISLADFSLGFFKNNLVAFGFGGIINIPPFGNNSSFPYMAIFNPTLGEYEFKVNLAGTHNFPVLGVGTTLFLNENSYLDVFFKGRDIYPTIHASGMLTLSAPVSKDTTKTFSVGGLMFEGMVISREKPYFDPGRISVVPNLRTPSLAGFELSITGVQPFESQQGRGITFQTGVALSDLFGGVANLRLYGDYERWKFKKIEVDKIKVNYQSEAFSLLGGVEFKNGDLVYGDGFRGDLQMTLLDHFKFNAIGIFGKKDNYRYFLTDVFYDMTPGGGIIIPPALSFYGFGGGLYKRMQQSSKTQQTVSQADLDFGKSLSGISYLPERNVGMGVMATTKFSLAGASQTFNAKVGFEIQFNDNGGLNFIQFRGDAAFMDIPGKWGGLMDNITQRMQKLEESGIIIQPKKTGKSEIDVVPENKSKGFLTASLNVEYDFIHKVFSADLSAYLNAGLIKGAGENDKLGWASAYFSPDKWYTYLGTPKDRLGVKVLNLAEVNAYFMLGDGIPGLPQPPSNVLNNLSPEKQAKLRRTSTEKLSMGKGIAFGAGLNLDFNAELIPFYAHLGIGMGTEFMLTNLNGRTCSNYDGVPGINGWYAQAQAWAYVEAGIGLQAKVFGKKRRFNILDFSVGALLEGAGPNPLYFSGAVGGRFSVLGGLVSGNCSFDFEIGEKCILSKGSPFGEDVIAQLTPGDGDKDISVFASPQALFNIPVGEEMEVDDEDVRGKYMVTLEEFYVKYKDNGQTSTGTNKFSKDGKVYILAPDEPMESQKEVEVYAKVGFKKKVNDKWVYVTGDDGNPAFESKTAVFHTGDRPKEILPEHVAYSYPLNRQYNFYTGEYKQGYLLLSQNYSYLFSSEKPEGFDQKIRISDAAGKSYEKPFSYQASSSVEGVRMEIDFSMEDVAFDRDKIYKMAIVNIPKQTGADITSNISTVSTAMEGMDEVTVNKQQATGVVAQLSEKEIYGLNFKTSQYATFTEKIKAFEKPSEGWRHQIEPYIHYIKTNLKEPESFDAYEIGSANVNSKIIRFLANVNQTDWYNQTLYKKMYETQKYLQVPVEKVDISVQFSDKLLTDDEISINTPIGYPLSGVFRYTLPYWFARDLQIAKAEIGKKLLGQITPEEVALLNRDFPPVVFQGNYPVSASYVLPGRNTTTSTVNFNMYNPEEP